MLRDLAIVTVLALALVPAQAISAVRVAGPNPAAAPTRLQIGPAADLLVLGDLPRRVHPRQLRRQGRRVSRLCRCRQGSRLPKRGRDGCVVRAVSQRPQVHAVRGGARRGDAVALRRHLCVGDRGRRIVAVQEPLRAVLHHRRHRQVQERIGRRLHYVHLHQEHHRDRLVWDDPL